MTKWLKFLCGVLLTLAGFGVFMALSTAAPRVVAGLVVVGTSLYVGWVFAFDPYWRGKG